MNLGRVALFIACIAPLAVTSPAIAQFSPVPQAQQAPACVQEFNKLRVATEKRAQAINDAGKRKPSPKEACALFVAYTTAEEKMLKYAVDNGVWCGIPPQFIDNVKKAHAKAIEAKTRICHVAAAPPRPAGPTLSDALSNPIPDANNIQRGRGTFDTLTGAPIGR